MALGNIIVYTLSLYLITKNGTAKTACFCSHLYQFSSQPKILPSFSFWLLLCPCTPKLQACTSLMLSLFSPTYCLNLPDIYVLCHSSSDLLSYCS